METKKLNHYLIVASAIIKNGDETFTINTNSIGAVDTDDGAIKARHLEHFTQLSLRTVEAQISAGDQSEDVYKVIDMTISNIIFLGLMTEAEFTQSYAQEEGVENFVNQLQQKEEA